MSTSRSWPRRDRECACACGVGLAWQGPRPVLVACTCERVRELHAAMSCHGDDSGHGARSVQGWRGSEQGRHKWDRAAARAHHSGLWRTEAAQWRVDAEAGRDRAVPRGDVDAGDRGIGVLQGLQQRRHPRRARLQSGVVLLFWPFPAAPPSSPVLPSSFFLSSTLGSLCFGVEAAAQRGKEPRGD